MKEGIKPKELIREPLKQVMFVFTYLAWKQVKKRIP